MLGDYIARALPELRAQAESMMLDTVTITRPGAVTTNPDSGAVNAAGATVYTGKARWKPGTSQAAGSDVGTAAMVSAPAEVHIPVGSYIPQAGDVITCTASQLNPALVGAHGTVRSTFDGSAVTAYRIPVEGVSWTA